jgi:hypothetical protein
MSACGSTSLVFNNKRRNEKKSIYIRKSVSFGDICHHNLFTLLANYVLINDCRGSNPQSILTRYIEIKPLCILFIIFGL